MAWRAKKEACVKSCPFPIPQSLSFVSLPCAWGPLPQIQLLVLRSAVSSPAGPGKAPLTNGFWCILSLSVMAPLQKLSHNHITKFCKNQECCPCSWSSSRLLIKVAAYTCIAIRTGPATYRWSFSDKKWWYGFESANGVPVWHTVPYVSLAAHWRIHGQSLGAITWSARNANGGLG